MVEVQSSLLQQRLSAVSDFEAAARAHAAFLAALTQQLFLELRVVGKTWEGILQSCTALAAAARLDDGSPASPFVSPTKVAEMEADFSRHAATLFMVLRGNKLAGSSRAPFLRLVRFFSPFPPFFTPCVHSTPSRLVVCRFGWQFPEAPHSPHSEAQCNALSCFDPGVMI